MEVLPEGGVDSGGAYFVVPQGVVDGIWLRTFVDHKGGAYVVDTFKEFVHRQGVLAVGVLKLLLTMRWINVQPVTFGTVPGRWFHAAVAHLHLLGYSFCVCCFPSWGAGIRAQNPCSVSLIVVCRRLGPAEPADGRRADHTTGHAWQAGRRHWQRPGQGAARWRQGRALQGGTAARVRCRSLLVTNLDMSVCTFAPVVPIM